MSASVANADTLFLRVKRRLVPSIDSLFHRTIDSMMKWINRQLFREIRFTRNALSGAFATNRHESCGLVLPDAGHDDGDEDGLAGCWNSPPAGKR